MKYIQILNENTRLKEAVASNPRYNVAVLSNLMTSQFNAVFEYSLRVEGINANTVSGNYDNILQDSIEFKDANLIIIFWELANLTGGFHYKSNIMSEEETSGILNKLKTEISYVISNLSNSSLVILNKFSTLAFTNDNIRRNNFERICDELNDYLETIAPPNFVLINVDKILVKNSIKDSIDFRFFYSSKTLYTINFYRVYAEFVKPIVLSVLGKSKKALIFDCDNTLWKGIIGEDGIEGIEMSGDSSYGTVFEEIQYMAVELSKRGVIIGLCSKNNISDVESVLNNSKMKLNDESIVIKKINWDDKVSNLNSIAGELNIGIDSLIFVDDSDFEINLVRSNLPQVMAIKVPENLFSYPELLRNKIPMFYSKNESYEDLARNRMYKEQIVRNEGKKEFGDIEDYLKSLDLKMSIYFNQEDQIPRIAQLTQKTNQFNLTTRRYTESDIARLSGDPEHLVITFAVEDKFGSYGIAGLSIIDVDKADGIALIDSLLMSCRIIGRNIEIAFMDHLISVLKGSGVRTIKAKFIRTVKNMQVADFFEKLHFKLIQEDDSIKEYQIELADYQFHDIKYIIIRNGKEN